MTPFIGQYVEYNQVYKDKPPSLEEIGKYFASIKTSHLLQLLCKMNISLWKSTRDEKLRHDVQKNLIKMLFPESDKERIYDLLNKKEIQKTLTVVFHRHQLLLAIKIILLNTENKEGVDLNADKTFLGKYLLALSDHLQPPQSPLTEGIPSFDFEYARQALSKLHYFSHSSIFVHNISRSLDMWLKVPFTTRFQSLLKRNSVSFDLNTEFLSETGISIEEYITLGTVNLINLANLDIHTDNPYDYMLQPRQLWSATSLTEEKQRKISEIYSQDINDFSANYDLSVNEMLHKKDIFESNFLALFYRPILNLNAEISVVSDPTYLEEWITSGVYWILLNRFRKDQKKANELSKYFGLLHQEYIHELLVNVCDQVIEIRERDGQKTCDFVGVIESKDQIYLLFIESKKIGLTLQVLLSGGRKETLKDLSKIFDESGFVQVYNTIKLFENEKLDEIAHVDRKKVVKIFPLLAIDRFIVEESLNRNLYEKEFLNKIVSNANLFFPQRVAQPIFLASEEFEILEASKQNEIGHDMLTFLQARDLKLNDRIRKGTTQPFPGFLLGGVGEIVRDLDTVWNDLFIGGYSKHKNKRLKLIFDQFMEKLKTFLFSSTKNGD